MAHDFNNILMALTGNLTMARLRLSRGMKPCRIWNMPLTRSTRPAKLTAQLLTFARDSVPQRTAINLHHALKEMVRTLTSAGREIMLQVRVERYPRCIR